MCDRRKAVFKLTVEHKFSERRACGLLCLSRTQYHYKSSKKEDPELVKCILELKEKHSYFGLPRILATLRRRGFKVNGKKVYRLLKLLRLMVPRNKRKKHLAYRAPTKMPEAIRVGDVWAMDFVHDKLSDNTSFRCLTVIDTLSRETPGIHAAQTMSGYSPVNFMETLKAKGPLPRHLILDNGPEFRNHAFTSWADANKISIHFIDPGKPVQNGYIESFNGKFRNEFLDQNSFKSVREVKSALEKWIKFYNEERPHSSLDYLTPKEFAEKEKPVLPTNTEPEINLLVLKTG